MQQLEGSEQKLQHLSAEFKAARADATDDVINGQQPEL